MRKMMLSTMDTRIIAMAAVQMSIDSDDGVQERLKEGCGFFALVMKDHAGNPYVRIIPISPANLGGNPFTGVKMIS